MLLWPIVKLLVMFSGLFSLAMFFPLLTAILYREERMIFAFGVCIAAILAVSLPVFIFSKKRKIDFTANEGILLVCLTWILAGLLGAAPYYLSGFIPRYVDAVFESVSGFTTTGATILSDLEILPRSFHLWRGITHWLGGLGIVVLTVALAPSLGAGGFYLVKAETTGPMKEKFTPKITVTAKILWLIYSGITLSMVALLMLGGMDWLDAVVHAFSTMGTGGFSTKNASIAAWNSPYIHWVCIVFMFIASFNFTLIYRLLQGKYGELIRNSEAKAYTTIFVIAALVVATQLVGYTGSVEKSLRYAFFDTVSIVSSTGLMIDDHSQWPSLAQFVVFMLMLLGGCSGSTAGGIKIIRYVILFKQTKNELLRNLYPRGVFSMQLDGKSGGKDIVFSVSSFFYLYAILVALGTLLVCSAGEGLYDSLNASLLILGNIGLGLGKLVSGTLFYEAPDYVKWGLSALMIIGRLEIYTFILLFTPEFWKNNF
ncbi:MAG: TrkH family potassium uptake protein [Treponema sp.]|jgi:trk system potassium uptake protein TrkH|nr:TrkH family potassium uptake protein [Treponema sp.]